MQQGLPLVWRKIPERYNLTGSRCEKCGLETFPRRMICKKCGSTKMRKKEMPRRGKIISFTEVFSAPRGFEHETPYFLALIELENKAVMTAQVVDCSEKEVKIGAKVEMVFRKISENGEEGIIAYGYKFRPVDEK